MFFFPPEGTDLAALEGEVLKFRLKVKCKKSAVSGSGGADKQPINGKVLSNQLEWIPVGNQVLISSERMYMI